MHCNYLFLYEKYKNAVNTKMRPILCMVTSGDFSLLLCVASHECQPLREIKLNICLYSQLPLKWTPLGQWFGIFSKSDLLELQILDYEQSLIPILVLRARNEKPFSARQCFSVSRSTG